MCEEVIVVVAGERYGVTGAMNTKQVKMHKYAGSDSEDCEN